MTATSVQPRPGLRRFRVSREQIVLLAPPLLFYVIFFVIPLGTLLIRSILSGSAAREFSGTPTLENYREALSDTLLIELLLRTLFLSVVVTVICVILGYLLAYVMIFQVKSRAVRRLFYICVLTPLFTSGVVRAFGWLIILGRQGFVNTTLMSMGVIHDPLKLVLNQTGVIIGLVHILSPFAFLSIASSLQTIDKDLELASRDLGASAFTAFRTVTWPLSLPGVVSGAVIAFTLTMSSYVVPSVLGGGYKVFAVEIYGQFLQSFDWNTGATLAVILMVPTFLVVWATNFALRIRTR